MDFIAAQMDQLREHLNFDPTPQPHPSPPNSHLSVEYFLPRLDNVIKQLLEVSDPTLQKPLPPLFIYNGLGSSEGSILCAIRTKDPLMVSLNIDDFVLLHNAVKEKTCYYADQLSPAPEVRANSTVTLKNRGFHLHNLSYAGPIVMGVGGMYYFNLQQSKTLDFESQLEIAQVRILAVTVALFINTIDLVLYRLSLLFCLIRSSPRPVVYEDRQSKA
ncbi:hypothetical protein J6590_037235 [Homalodisca vitripennis]|nr:hypothetical protein J6590_037235 [Homalodisca vitripennis]